MSCDSDTQRRIGDAYQMASTAAAHDIKRTYGYKIIAIVRNSSHRLLGITLLTRCITYLLALRNIQLKPGVINQQSF